MFLKGNYERDNTVCKAWKYRGGVIHLFEAYRRLATLFMTI